MEGIPPSTIPNVVSPLARGVADPALSAPDFGQTPLTNPKSAAPASKNLVVFRGLSELEVIKLFEHLQEQVPAPVLSTSSGMRKRLLLRHLFPDVLYCTEIGNTVRLDTTPPHGFQPRLILHQESHFRFFSCGRCNLPCGI
jgi:hypothetical protein